MSQAAVMMAVRAKLQSVFSLDSNSCEIGFDGAPKPMAGEFYVAIHPMAWSGLGDEDWALGEEYTVGVTLTMRMGVAPKDRWGIAIWLANPDGGAGMEARVRTTITAIHHNQDIRLAANALISGGASGKIMTPLQLMPSGIQLPKVQVPSWFSAAPPETEHGMPECGVSQTIIFGKCQRVQSIPDMD